MYECKKATSDDNLVEAVMTVGTEEDVAFDHAPSEEFLKAGWAPAMGVLK